MRTRAACVLFALAISVVGCGDSSSPTAPSPTPVATTRIINVSGNLAFGEVLVGGRRDATLTITNTGNAGLTVTSLSVSGGLAQHTSASWTSGPIAAGGSQQVTVSFEPVAAGTYTGTLAVNADHTSGTNTIAISGTALPNTPFAGNWSGTYIVERCDGTGSLQDLLCSANRGAFPPGTSLPLTIELSQSGSSVAGTLALGQVRGVVTGVVGSAGALTLQGTLTSGMLTAQITSWTTRVQGTAMEGTFAYNATVSGVPGVGVVVARLGRVTK
jgi:Abnormal spindle-like microcephaly-assoc'd, ASPM-SPD-2-Hydin